MNAAAAATATPAAAAPSPAAREAATRRGPYLRCVHWLFLVSSSGRLFAYLPTILTLWEQRSSNQHSLITWLVFAVANASMAAWLYEQHGRRLDRAILVSMGNAVMCTATAVLILTYR